MSVKKKSAPVTPIPAEAGFDVAAERRDMRERNRVLGRALYARVVQRLQGNANATPPIAALNVGALEAEEVAMLANAAARLEQVGLTVDPVPPTDEVADTVPGMLDQLANGFGEQAGRNAAQMASRIWDALRAPRRRRA
jgi:hypothetical protein